MVSETDKEPLHLGNDIAALELVIKEDELVKQFKKKKSLNKLASKFKTDILQCQNDQERCYVLCRRYLILMDYLMKTSEDQNYITQMYDTDIKRIKNLLDTLKRDLEIRYNEKRSMSIADNMQLRLELDSQNVPLSFGSRSSSDLSSSIKTSSGGSASTSGSRHYIQPNAILSQGEKNPYFSGIFITPTDLFNLLFGPVEMKILLVDIREEQAYKKCRIEPHRASIINIPGDLITPGLSANALSETHLTGITQDIWESRDEYNIIVLLDAETEKYNYPGSKLERLRESIVDWDINRTYIQDPVVLEGGLREYVEFYPTEVTNSLVYMNQRNSEMDDILHLERVSYPDTGSSSGNNSKVHVIDSIADVRFRVRRDFPEDSDMENESFSFDQDTIVLLPPREGIESPEMAVSPLGPLSPRDRSPAEGDLSLGLRPSSTSLMDVAGAASPRVSPRISPRISPRTDGERPLSPSRSNGDITGRLRAALEADKSDMLREARSKKPKALEYGDIGASGSSVSSGPKQEAPPIYRSTKPDLPEYIPREGKGFCGISNLHNNCFMSSILQSIKVLPCMLDMYITSNKYLRLASVFEPAFSEVFAQTMRKLWAGTYDIPELTWPSNFKRKIDDLNPLYRKHNHEDAFEFFLFLVDALGRECLYEVQVTKGMTDNERGWHSLLSGRTSYIMSPLYHQIKNSKTCLNCKNVSLNFDIESSLMLAVPPKGTTPLQKLVDEYASDSIVEDYVCTDCKCKASIVNSRSVVVLPQTLVIVLKRYGYDADGVLVKYTTDVPFPTRNLMFGNQSYRLKSFVHHIGNLVHGHYFATVQLDHNVWVKFNDEQMIVYSRFEEDMKRLGSEAAGFFYILDESA